MEKLKAILLLMLLLWSLETEAQKYEFYKEISGYASDSSNFQYSSGLAQITIDRFDNIYILDWGGRGVIKLDSNKKFVSKWYSADYADNREVQKQNSDRPWSAMFNYTRGIKTDFYGNVYVFGFGKIQKFDTNGKYLTTISNVRDYEDIAFDRLGNFYAVTQKTIEKLNPKGELLEYFVPKIEIKGKEEEHIMNSIVLDSDNNVYVLDRGLRKILKFNNKGKYINAFCKAGQGDGEILDAEGLAIDKNNDIYISDNTSWRIQCIDSNGRFKYRIGRDSTTVDKIIYPHAVAIDSKGHIYVQSLYNGVVEYDLNRQYVATWGTDGNIDGSLIAPNSIFISKDNFLYIADEKKPTIQKFDLEGRFIEVFLKTKDLTGSSYQVRDIDEDEDDHIVLLTSFHDNPVVFVDKKGYYHKKYTAQNKEHFLQGKSLVLQKDNVNDNDENYFVSSYRSGHVKKIASSGYLLLQFNSIDTSRVDLFVPDFVLDDSGNVIVGFEGHSIQKFDKHGKFLNYVVKYDSMFSGRGFRSIALDLNGYVYALNGDCEVLIFDSFDVLRGRIKLNNRMTPCLNTEEQIAVTSNGELLYVTDKENYRVQIFRRVD